MFAASAAAERKDTFSFELDFTPRCTIGVCLNLSECPYILFCPCREKHDSEIEHFSKKVRRRFAKKLVYLVSAPL